MTEQASRRDVLRLLSLAGAAVAFETHAATASTPFTIVVNDMKLRFYPYTLELRCRTRARQSCGSRSRRVRGRRPRR